MLIASRRTLRDRAKRTRGDPHLSHFHIDARSHCNLASVCLIWFRYIVFRLRRGIVVYTERIVAIAIAIDHDQCALYIYRGERYSLKFIYMNVLPAMGKRVDGPL